MRAIKFVLILLLAASCPVRAGVGLITGEDESDWTRGQVSVIIARVESVQPEDPDRYGDLAVTLLPQATLGGTFDCGAEPRITPSCWYAIGGNSALRFRPEKGMLVLALVCRFEMDPQLRIPNYNCPMLPDKQPLYRIKGMDDPEIAKTLERIQKARAIAKQKHQQEMERRQKGK